ncbi:MAG: leucyl aminopeptidase [Alphaproteobacteria bacterium]|nr:leucyl aminopeptidase [Alphaproteobacteria bacterium]
MTEIRFAAPALPKDGALVLPMAEGTAPAGLAAQVDRALSGRLKAALKAARFAGKKGQTATLLAPGAGLSRVIAVGLGKAAELTEDGIEAAGGTAMAALLAGADLAGAIAADLPQGAPKGIDAAAFAARLALGARLRSYRFDRYRTTEKPEDKPALKAATLLGPDPARAKAAYAPLGRIADGVFITRDLVSEPPNVLNPAVMAERCRALGKLGVKVEVMGPRELRRLGFNTLLAVAQGSANEARVVVMRWNGAPRRGRGKGKGGAAPVAFVGKGVTFDTGGISIKPAAGMEDMKWDMAGAGAVVGLMAALAGRKAKVDAVGIVGLVENMPSGTAQRPGDVVKSYSGQTIEVLNTDAEGRLVLADCLWYCQERFKPRFMVDLATLTGAIIISLGHENAGLFASDDTLAAQIIAAGKATGEECWRMPLGDAYDKQLKSDIADMKNIGGRPGGSITAAQFLQRFVNKVPWAHLDIAGVAWQGKDKPAVPKGATAFGVRLLDRLVAEHYESR